jgi:hypothetical protein
MIDREHVLAQVQEYCEFRNMTKLRGDPDLLVNGHGNTEQVSSVVLFVIDWIEGVPEAREAISYRPDQTNLADVTGMAVHELTRRNFPWEVVSSIIKKAGETSLLTGKLDGLVAKYPKAAGRFLGLQLPSSDNWGKNVNRVVQDLAKTILWSQSFSFLVEHGYRMPE